MALYFGIERINSVIITGAPQYMLGNYLALPNHQQIHEYIMGDCSKESIDNLNLRMGKVLDINKNNNNNNIYIHYSTEEETYVSDIKPLLENLENLNINKRLDKNDYKNHSDLTRYFPRYIQKILAEQYNM